MTASNVITQPRTFVGSPSAFGRLRGTMRRLLLMGVLARCGGSTTPPACDAGPGNLSGGCEISSAGQCVEWASLSQVDLTSVQGVCSSFGGQWLSAPCADAGLVGACTIPPQDPNTGVTCSPQGKILQHYYSPHYDAGTARLACEGAPGTTFLP